MPKEIVIIGAGVAGLTCAHYLKSAGRDVLVIDKSDAPGGRIRTDIHDGYRLDRGFQIFLTAYPEAKAILDYEELDLRYFENGAIIHAGNRQVPMFDPSDNLWLGIRSLIQGPLIFGDGMKMLGWKARVQSAEVASLYEGEEMSSMACLQGLGLSKKNIEGFWKPFYQGIFLENELHTDRALLEFTFKMFQEEGAAIPANGMQTIPNQLAQKLGEESIRLNTEIHELEEGRIRTVHGDVIQADIVVDAAGLTLGKDIRFKDVTNLYLIADEIPEHPKVIHLHADKDRVVNNVAFLSEVSPAYRGENGKSLISASANGEYSELAIRRDLEKMFGPMVKSWESLKKYHIREALPDIPVRYTFEPKVREGLFRCGDQLVEGSINGAMRSGRLAAEAILQS